MGFDLKTQENKQVAYPDVSSFIFGRYDSVMYCIQ